MRSFIIRFVSLYVFNVGALVLMGWLVPGVRVGLSALWAAVILTLATIWLKPFIGAVFRKIASGNERIKSAPKKIVEYVIVFAVAAAVWLITVLTTGVSINGFFWGWFLGPIALLIVWAIYDVVDDMIQKRVGNLYDSTIGKGSEAKASEPDPEPYRAPNKRDELRDSLTEEQKKLFDQL